MANIFDILPTSFFNLFNANNKHLVSDCLLLLYDYLKEESSSKDNVIFELTNYFNTHIIDIESDDHKKILSSKDKAYYFYRRLKDFGWINEEEASNYDILVYFEDYAINIMETLFNLGKENVIEYAGYVYRIYSSFVNFEITKGDLIFEQEYHATYELMIKLKTLSTNIRKYIQKLLTENIRNDLDKLLDSLLNDYQMKVIDRAFYNLTTKDNPSKYRGEIITKITYITENEQYVDTIVRNIMDKKDIEYQEAYQLFYMQANYIIDSFGNIDQIIKEITRKNEKFVESATQRITFLINTHDDIGGKINAIIKGMDVLDSKEVFCISTNRILDKNSLYTPRKYYKAVQSTILDNACLDEELKQDSLNKIRKSNEYAKKSIDKQVLFLLENQELLTTKDLYNHKQDIIFVILTWLYGFSKSAAYVIESKETNIHIEKYMFRDFIIRRK